MEIEITDGIEFGRVGERPLLAKCYRPAGSSERTLPLIVWIFGGAWLGGDRHNNGKLCQEIARHGFVCLSIDYRLSSEAIFPAAIEDCKCAIRFVRANSAQLGIDPERIGVWGVSSGGYLAALLGTSANVSELEGKGGWAGFSSAVQAVCDWFGPTDFLKMAAFPSEIDHDAADSPESRFVGGKIQERPAMVQRANPITYISSAAPPFFIAHGKADPLVPFNQSELLVEALVVKSIEVAFAPLEDAGHGGAGFEAGGDLFERCIAFFKQILTSRLVPPLE